MLNGTKGNCMKSILIVGNGPQGIAAACALRSGGVTSREIKIIDPSPEPCAVLQIQMSNSLYGSQPAGTQALMRSGWKAHSAPNPDDLIDFARADTPRSEDFTRLMAANPPAHLFFRHERNLLDRFHLAGSIETGRVEGASLSDDGHLAVATSEGDITTDHLVLAIGNPQLNWPSWASGLLAQHPLAPIHHVFDLGFRRDALPKEGEHNVVVGGGITAIQTALAMSRLTSNAVTVISRRPMETGELDFGPDWLTDAKIKELDGIPSIDQRSQIALANRRPGTVPASLAKDFLDAVAAGRIFYIPGEHVAAAETTDSGVKLVLEDGSEISANNVILATGFQKGLPGGDMLERTLKGLGLYVSPQGVPEIDHDLRFSGTLPGNLGVYGMGWFAMPIIGPSAPNVIGGQKAAQRIAHDILARQV